MKKFTLKIKQVFAALLMLACIPANAQFTATVEQYANSDWSSVAAEFTLTEVANALETDTATLVAALDAWYNYDESTGAEAPADMFFLKVGDELNADYSTNARGGFWMSGDCRNVGYGAEAVFYQDIWYDQAEDYFSLNFGQMPDTLAAGATFTPTFVLKHGEKQATFTITYIVKPLPTVPEAEVAIAKLEIVGSAEVTIEQYPRNNYNSSAAYVNIADAAEKLGINKEELSIVLSKVLYKARVNETYQTKIDSLTLATNHGGWGRVVLDPATGDTLKEVCAAPWSNLDAYYMDSWAYDASNDTLTCYIGQYPDALAVGNEFYTNIYIVYGNKAYVVKYNVNIIENPNAGGCLEEMIKMGESVIRVETEVNTDYASTPIYLNMDSIAGVLGCAVGDITFQGIDNKGALSTSSTANNGGFWMTQGGVICSWGDNAYFFIEPSASNDYSQLNMGQMPGNTAVGEEANAKLYFTVDNKYYELNITLALVEGVVVDQDAFESVATRKYTVQALDETYTWSSNSANIPFTEIYELIGTTEPVLYALNVDTIAAQTGEKYTKDYTMGEKPGFWLSADGCKASWGSAPWGITGLNSTAENFVIQCIQMDGYCSVGESFKGTFFLVNEETQKMITIELTYQIVETIVSADVVGEEWLTLPVSTNDIETEYDLTKVATAFGLESVSDLFEGYYLKGKKEDGIYSEGVSATTGVTFNTAGGADTYGDLGIYFSEDGTKIATYSNSPVDALNVEVVLCFEIDGKCYVLNITLQDETTYADGIEEIVTDNNQGKIYNLQGIEVANPTKGIYIQNGKKFIVK